MKITEIAIKRPAFMTMIFSALAVVGIWAYTNMGVDFLPKMDFPFVLVSTVYPGAGPKEVETQVSKPIEEALSSLNGLKSLRTFSGEGISFAMVEFKMSTNSNTAVTDVDRKINEIKQALPKEILQPLVAKADMNALPILRIALTANIDQNSIYQFVKDKIKTRLEQIDGISRVVIIGGKEREIRVEIDGDKLRAYNLSILQVSQILAAENIDFPTGSIQEKDKKYTVRVAGKFDKIESIKNMIIASTPAGTIYLKDIAQVIDGYKEDYTLSRLNGEPGIGLIIQKASDANSIKTSDRVQKVLKNLENEYAGNNLKFIISQDITNFTRQSLNDVGRDLGIAVLMVALILFVFLHNFKNAFIVLLSIPTSLISSFIMMYALGFTINLITLMALTLVIGILVDDSIVVLENIHRHIEKGEPPREAAIKGRSEIGMAAIAITLVDVVVFLPVAMVGGMVGMIFREFGLTIVVSTLFSLFVSFTLTPLLASRWAKITEYTNKSLLNRFFAAFDNWENRFSERYKMLLAWALDHRKTILSLSFGLLIISIMFIPLGIIGTEFMPSVDRGEFAVNIEMPLGTNLEKTDIATTAFEKIVAASPLVERYYTVVGLFQEQWGEQKKTHISQLQIKLKKNIKIKTQDVIDDFLEKAHSIPGIKASASLIGIFGAGDETPIYLEVKGIDLNKIIQYSDKVLDVVSKTKGTRDVKSSWEEGSPEIQIVIDRERSASFGLTLGEVALAMRNSLEGDNSSKFRENDTEYDIRIILNKANRSNPENVKNITVSNRRGQLIKLTDVATAYFGKGPATIGRKDRSRIITITSNLNDTRPLSEVMDDIDKKIKTLNLPDDIVVQKAGASEDMATMFSDMLLAIMFAVLFVYIIMVSLYESFVYPFIIMFSLPVALFGAFMALFLFNNNLNTFSMIGILMSMGLVTKNAILLVDYTNNLRAQGMDMRTAILTASPIRLRPIIMTTSTMVIGMLPLAIGVGGAGEMRSGLAVIVIGALLSSTLLTLVLVPVMYTLMEGFRTRLLKLFRKQKMLSSSSSL